MVSEYGTFGQQNSTDHRDKEYVAETFALYMEGEHLHYRIHPELLAVFQRFDLGAVVKAFSLQEVKAVKAYEQEPLADPNSGTDLIAAVFAAPEDERERVAAELLAAYTDIDKPLIEAWLWEGVGLLRVDKI